MHDGQKALADMGGADREGDMEWEKLSGDQMKERKRSERRGYCLRDVCVCWSPEGQRTATHDSGNA